MEKKEKKAQSKSLGEPELTQVNPEPKKEKKRIIQRVKERHRLATFILMLALILLFAGIWYLQMLESRVYIEKAEINAPIISLGPQAPGILNEIYVKEGDFVHKDKIVAVVGNQSLRTKTSGIIIGVKNTPGQLVSMQDYVVQMIDPREFRVVGRIEEDKGLSEIKPGQHVVFTVDTFGSKEYVGVVDSISPTSRQSDIVFSISDKREQKEFNVKVSYNVEAYPELKNGMSAKMWVYKQ